MGLLDAVHLKKQGVIMLFGPNPQQGQLDTEERRVVREFLKINPKGITPQKEFLKDKRQEGWVLMKDDAPLLCNFERMKVVRLCTDGKMAVGWETMCTRASILGGYWGQHQAEELMQNPALVVNAAEFATNFPRTIWIDTDGKMRIPLLRNLESIGSGWKIHFERVYDIHGGGLLVPIWANEK